MSGNVEYEVRLTAEEIRGLLHVYELEESPVTFADLREPCERAEEKLRALLRDLP